MPSSKQLPSSSSKHKPRTRHSSVESVMSTSADSDTQRVKNVSLATKNTSKSSPKVDLLFTLFSGQHVCREHDDDFKKEKKLSISVASKDIRLIEMPPQPSIIVVIWSTMGPVT